MSIRESAPRAAVFLDRDGTIIDDVHYIARPELVRLRPGAGEAIGRLNRAHLPVIVVTNQSGIARGIVTESDYQRVQQRMSELLAEHRAHIDASYMCPHHPDFGPDCDCRKPGTQLFRAAARDHGLDLARSTYIGDRWRDVAPGIELGGRGMLLADGHGTPQDFAAANAAQVPVVASLSAAIARLLSDDTWT